MMFGTDWSKTFILYHSWLTSCTLIPNNSPIDISLNLYVPWFINWTITGGSITGIIKYRYSLGIAIIIHNLY